MASRIFQGGTTDWYLPGSWSPTGTPAAGDTLSVGGGSVTISASDVLNFGSLDNEVLMIGGASAGAAAGFSADGATFGSGFTITGLGSAFANIALSGSTTFGGTLIAATSGGQTTVNIASSGTLALTGTIAVSNGGSVAINSGTIVDTGVISVSNGMITIGGSAAVTGPGTIAIGANGTVLIDGPVASGVSVVFTAANGTLLLADPLFFDGSVSGFVKGDVIDLLNAPSYIWTYNSTSGRLTVLGAPSANQSPEVAKFRLTSTATLNAHQIFVGQDGAGGSEIQLAETRIWNGGTGDFYTTANWTTLGTTAPNSYPLFGDTATINAGTVTITDADVSTFGTLNNNRIILSGDNVRLQIAGDTLGGDLRITNAASHVSNTVTFAGTTTSGALIQVTGNGALLNFAVGNDGTVAGDFINTQPATILAGNGASLNFRTGRVTNQGQITVNGAATISAAVTIDGTGVIQLGRETGTLSVAGTITAGQQIAFTSTGQLIIQSGAQVQGTIESLENGGTIDLAGVTADFASYDPAADLLTIRNGGSAGSVVATLTVAGPYGANDFNVFSDGHGGSDITTFGLGGAPVAWVTLRVPAVAASGGTVSLGSLFGTAFGGDFLTTLPSFQLWSASTADLDVFSYWNPDFPALSGWTVNGSLIAPDNLQSVPSANLATVEYVAGNAIWVTARVQVPVAFDSLGNPTFYTNYSIQNFAPGLGQPSLNTGKPTAQDIVNAASAFSAAYSGAPNTEDCWNIAAEIAAAAGATPGRFTASTTPQDNHAYGLWRIAYAAPQDGSAVTNWGSLVQAGDQPRVGWTSGGAHSFTILAPLDTNSDITVFDNADWSNNYEALGTHTAQYWNATAPEQTTIFRLDPNDLYLINYVTADNAIVQGTLFDDLIMPEGVNGTLIGGADKDWFVQQAAVMDGATITDFAAGDTIDLTNLLNATASVDYDPGSGDLAVRSAGSLVATIHLPTGLIGSFAITNDGGTAGLDGGTLGSLYKQLYDTPSSTDSRIALVPCFTAGTRIRTTTGERAIETLSVGDPVTCHDGTHRPIIWIGRRRLDPRRHPHPERILPIRIEAGAFGKSLPGRALLLSPDHAVFANNVLIPARCLINGRTIRQVSIRRCPEITYFHIELERHDVILAEGLAVESYLDTGDRSRFSNGGGAIALHPDFASLTWDARACALLSVHGPALDAVRAELERQADARPARRFR